MKWASAHFYVYTYYVSVVPIKYQSFIYGDASSSLSSLKQYQNILEDYIALAPDGTDRAATEPRLHGLFSAPGALAFNDTEVYTPKCSNGWCPDDLYGDRVMLGDDKWLSHDDEPTAAAYTYAPKYVSDDARVRYDSAKYPCGCGA